MSSTEVEVIERRSLPLRPLDIEQTLSAQRDYQEGLNRILDPTEDVTPIRGRGGKVKNHVNRSGVSKIAKWCSVSTVRAPVPDAVTVERDADGKPRVWTVTVRAEASDGRVADGVGAFDITERPSKKPEHDGLGTAFTRARNRAVMDLIGMGEVSAEEMTAGAIEHDGTALPFGPEATLDESVRAQDAIAKMVSECPGDLAVKVFTNNFGYFPQIAARTILGMLWLSEHPAPADTAERPAGAPQGPPDGTGAPPEGNPTGDPASPVQGPTAAQGAAVSGPSFDEVVTPGDGDIDDVDIDAIMDDPKA